MDDLSIFPNALVPGAVWSESNCRFAVWAPRAQRVELRLLDPEQLIPMQSLEHGWFQVVRTDIQPGRRYFFRLDGQVDRPDPASRHQPEGVHGPSAVSDPRFDWHDRKWTGVPLSSLLLYELHVGTFTPEGTFEGILGQLDRLADLGVNAIELMPVAAFPGTRNWGYDGVFPFAVQHSYGGVVGLKRLVDACHRRGLAVFLDVVYNHLGPEGNYLRDFAPYFTDQYRTPWGEALNFDGPGSDPVRSFVLASALRWQEEFHMDGLRLDAVHAIRDFSAKHILAELAEQTHQQATRLGRTFHVIAESDLNDPRLVQPPEKGGFGLDSAWNDDFHHAVHTLLTGERDGYYEDFGTLQHLAQVWRDGWVYAGVYSPHRDRRHGAPPVGLSRERFVVCVQNHDQVGNRACGERLGTLVDFSSIKLAAGLLLLSPYVPLLFMGEEYGETAPFLYFTSHGDPALIEAVRRGRREEFARFAWQGEVPDPQSEETFLRSRLTPEKGDPVLLAFHRELIALRRRLPLDASREVVIEEARQTLRVTYQGQAEVMLLFHLGRSTQRHGAWPAGKWRCLFDSAASRWRGEHQTLEHLESSGEITLSLPPRSFVVYQRED